MTELARVTCPSCKTTWDVWVEADGRLEDPEKIYCPDCLFGRKKKIPGRFDEDATSLFGSSLLDDE